MSATRVSISGSGGSFRRTAASASMSSSSHSLHNTASSTRHLLPTSSSFDIDNDSDANDSHGDADTDEEDAHVMNLTLDGVQEGPYMLCKHADDLLGHHARQVFREKAASMRGDNSIYYYLKGLMRTFGSVASSNSNNSTTKTLEPEALVLEPHAFRKLIASDPAFEGAIATEQVDALFHRIEDHHERVIRLADFVEFCLLDHNQLRLLLFKYRRGLKRQRLTDNELSDTFRRLSRSDSNVMAPELLHAAISRDVDVVLTTGELAFVMRLMDYDRDGVIQVHDLEQFVKDDAAARTLLHPARERAVVDLRLSVHAADQVTFERDGYTQLFPKLQADDTNLPAMHLWFRAAASARDDSRAAIASIQYAASARESELIARGFTRLAQDVNRAGAFGKRKYIWLSYAPPASVQTATTSSEVIDIALTSGPLSDAVDAQLWLPPHRGFKRVVGNLNDKSTKIGVFLWLRRRRLATNSDLVDPDVDTDAAAATASTPDGAFTTLLTTKPPMSALQQRLHIDDMEAHIRRTLRRNCPIDQDGSLNLARLFDEFDVKKVRGVSAHKMLRGIELHGIKMTKKDFALVWDRMNPFKKKQLDMAAFAQFLELNDSEIDDVVNALQRSMTTRSASVGGSAPNYRAIFQSYNALGDGRLSRSDFQRLCATTQRNFTAGELSKVMQRFDTNRDGVVDYTDFLRYVTGVCDASARIAARVFAAADEIRTWAIERQNRKLAKDGYIDSSTAWKQLLKTKCGIVETAALDHILRQRSVRLDADKLQLLSVLIAPAANGEINDAAFHAFVNHYPKKIKTMVYDLKKVVGPVPSDETQSDAVFDRLNVEGNGKLSLVHLARETNALALEKSVNALELKDFVYVVVWTGASCGGGGAVLIDRFIATIREIHDRRNMKHEFVTHYDSPSFVEGVQLLRDEIKKCAKTLDGRLNYRVPFNVFDTDHSGAIVLSEFERAVRELGVDKYLSDQEVKSLMRRFDVNATGAIDYDEFLRFNLAESTSAAVSTMLATASSAASSRKLVTSGDSSSASTSVNSDVRCILDAIVVHERLRTAVAATAFCSSLKRMFAILDKDSSGVVAADMFAQTLIDMGLAISQPDMRVLVTAFGRKRGNPHDNQRENRNDTGVQYQLFCELLQDVCCARTSDNNSSSANNNNTQPPSELLALLQTVYAAFHTARRKAAKAGHDAFDVYRAFHVTEAAARTTALFLSVEELKDVLWTAGVRHPYLREELDALLASFQLHDGAGFNVALFAAFLDQGVSALFHSGGAGAGALDVYITRLQDQLQSYLASGSDTHARLQQLFADVDADNSGAISPSEFVTLLQRAGLRHFLSPDDEALLLQFLDTNRDGSIAYTEFLAFATHADATLNAAVASGSALAAAAPQSPARSPARSPTKSASPVKPTTTSPTHKPNDVSDNNNNNDSPSDRQQREQLLPLAPHDWLVYRIARLNTKLRPAFPFAKYFRKYATTIANNEVKTRVFDKVIDKFLATLTQRGVAFNMLAIDSSLLTTFYSVRDGAAIDCDAFLHDLATVSARVRAARQRSRDGRGGSMVDSSSSSSDDDDDGELSCSSDEHDASSERKHRMLVAVLRDAVQRSQRTSSPAELVQLQQQLTRVASDWTRTHHGRIEHVTERKIYKLLTKFGVRLRASEADVLLPALAASDAHGRSRFDAMRLFAQLKDVLDAMLSSSNSSTKAVEALPAAPAPAQPQPTSTLPCVALAPALAEKIYRCFVAAAQHNVSGHKLLEKCDVQRTGSVSVLEFQTVLRLMGCALNEPELAQLKQALGNDVNAQLSYRALVEQISLCQQRDAAVAAAANGATRKPKSRLYEKPVALQSPQRQRQPQPRPLPIHVPSSFASPSSPMRQSSAFWLSQLPAPPPAPPLLNVSTTIGNSQPLSRDDMLRIDALLVPLFAELLRARQVTHTAITQRFAAYDARRTGFVSIDAFASVLRALDVWLTADVTSTVLRRFATAAGDQFDYIAFCQLVCRDASSTNNGVQVAPLPTPAPTPITTASKPLPVVEADAVNADDRWSTKRSSPLDNNSSRHNVETVKPPKTVVAAAIGWRCAVCFHTQTRATSTCEICAAQDPASVAHELLLQCAACAFRNKPTATVCDLCRMPLRTHSAAPVAALPIKTKARSYGSTTYPSSPTKALQQNQRQYKLKPKANDSVSVPYDEGWLT